jgi:hypothetical protein
MSSNQFGLTDRDYAILLLEELDGIGAFIQARYP